MLQSARSRALNARLALLAMLGAMLVAVGCGSPPPLDKQLETLASWTATLQLAKERHGSGAITITYAAELRDQAAQALDDGTRTIGESAHTHADSSYAAAALDSLRGAIRQLEAETGS
jgi:hypothetical protein